MPIQLLSSTRKRVGGLPLLCFRSTGLAECLGVLRTASWPSPVVTHAEPWERMHLAWLASATSSGALPIPAIIVESLTAIAFEWVTTPRQAYRSRPIPCQSRPGDQNRKKRAVPLAWWR